MQETDVKNDSTEGAAGDAACKAATASLSNTFESKETSELVRKSPEDAALESTEKWLRFNPMAGGHVTQKYAGVVREFQASIAQLPESPERERACRLFIAMHKGAFGGPLILPSGNAKEVKNYKAWRPTVFVIWKLLGAPEDQVNAYLTPKKQEILVPELTGMYDADADAVTAHEIAAAVIPGSVEEHGALWSDLSSAGLCEPSLSSASAGGSGSIQMQRTGKQAHVNKEITAENDEVTDGAVAGLGCGETSCRAAEAVRASPDARRQPTRDEEMENRSKRRRNEDNTTEEAATIARLRAGGHLEDALYLQWQGGNADERAACISGVFLPIAGGFRGSPAYKRVAPLIYIEPEKRWRIGPLEKDVEIN